MFFAGKLSHLRSKYEITPRETFTFILPPPRKQTLLQAEPLQPVKEEAAKPAETTNGNGVEEKKEEEAAPAAEEEKKEADG